MTVEARTRRDAFAAAIKASRDANNLYAVELGSDQGRTVDPSTPFGGVPYAKPDMEPSPLYDADEDHLRPYELSVEVFGETQGAEYVWAPRLVRLVPRRGRCGRCDPVAVGQPGRERRLPVLCRRPCGAWPGWRIVAQLR